MVGDSALWPGNIRFDSFGGPSTQNRKIWIRYYVGHRPALAVDPLDSQTPAVERRYGKE